MPFFSVDEDFNVNTGLVSYSRDVAGISTELIYDDLGRIETVKPVGQPWVLYEYWNATGNTPMTLRVTTRPEGTTQSTTPITEAYVYYDWLGRTIQQKVKAPSDTGSQWSTTNTKYDFFNRAIRVTVPEFRAGSTYESGFTPAKWTDTSYDIFGRPRQITGPDTKTRTASYAGKGVRDIATTVEMALATGTAGVTSHEIYDAYGRLVRVEEGNGTKTQYSYESSGQLKKVCQNTTDNGETCGQTRTFVYDNRGFLISETHPENGTATYVYDAKGHALTKSVSVTNSEANLTFTYDGAERLTAVETRDPSASEFRAGKSFVFGTANTGTNDSNKKLGKLVSATRHNYGVGHVVVTESYDYEDPAGRLSKTTTDITREGVLLKKLEQSQAYATNGNVGTINYPTCLAGTCGAAAWDTLTLTHTHGALTGVGQFADSITYRATGAISKVDHAGPVVDTYAPDETGVRPKTITFDGLSTSTCAPPLVDSATPANQSITSGQTATLIVTATGATGYQWFEANQTKINGATSYTYTTPALTATKSYYVEVINSCGKVTSRVATVEVGSCPAPSITGEPEDQSVAPEHQVELSVGATGNPTHGALTYQWYEWDGGQGTAISGATAAAWVTPQIYGSKNYYVIVSNNCSSVQSRIVTITMRELQAPSGVVATGDGASSVTISWNPSPDAHHYQIERKQNGTEFSWIKDASGTSTIDNYNLATDKAYLYRVTAVSENEYVASPPSNADVATTITFASLTAGQTKIAASDLEKLRIAVNALREAKGDLPLAWTSILPAGVPAPGSSQQLLADHVKWLRLAMNNARQALGLWSLTFTDPSLIGVRFKVQHVTEIRGGVQ